MVQALLLQSSFHKAEHTNPPPWIQLWQLILAERETSQYYKFLTCKTQLTEYTPVYFFFFFTPVYFLMQLTLGFSPNISQKHSPFFQIKAGCPRRKRTKENITKNDASNFHKMSKLDDICHAWEFTLNNFSLNHTYFPHLTGIFFSNSHSFIQTQVKWVSTKAELWR